MFQQGGEATPNFSIVDPGKTLTAPRFSPRDSLYFSTPQIVSESFDIVQDDTGQFYGQLGESIIPIDMAYGNTPREALRNMEKERGIQELKNKFITAASIIALKRPIGSTGSFLGKAFYNPKPKGIDFVVTPAGIEVAAGKFTPFAKGLGLTGLSGGAYIGGDMLADAAVTTPAEEAAAKEKEAEQKVDVQTQDQIAKMLDEFSFSSGTKTSEDLLKDVSTQPSVKVKDSKVTSEEDKEEMDKAIIEEATQPRNLQTIVGGNQNFLNLIRNFSVGLATGETFAEGMAIGAASAAEERKASEDLLAEREFEMEKLGIKAASDLEKEFLKRQLDIGKDFKNKQAEYETDLANASFEYDTSDAVIQAINDARKLVATGSVTGLTPLVQEYYRKTKAFFGGGTQLTNREIAKNLINDIINGNIKELTGESGRTISNLDRQVAANLIGAIDWKADQATVLQKLGLAEQRAKKKKDSSYKIYLAARKPFENAGYKIPSQFDVTVQKPLTEERVRLQIRN